METEMGYRGSKSEFQTPQPKEIFVKEQRVDGSYFGLSPKLRCTLTGFERNYPIKIPSKQLNKKSFSTLNFKSEHKINPWFLTGFTDAEGCFSIKLQHNAKLKTKWRVRPVFSITLHIKDLSLLEFIKKSLGVGNISKSGEKAVMFAVDSIKEIHVIINHFDKYSLVTQKLSDYLIFKQCFEIIKQNKHLTERGLLEIIGLKSNLNLGLSAKIKETFPSVIKVNRQNYKFKGIPDPLWVSGFICGEGSFQIIIRNSNNEVFARFSIHLHIRDLEVLKGLSNYFKTYSTVFTEKKVTILEKSAQLQISKFSDIDNIIIPFFNQYPILGMKSLDFIDFKKACHILKTKKHLNSPSIFNKIIKIKSGMNLNRKW